MEGMCPLEKDYYVTEYFSDGEDRGSDSSDDEIQKRTAKAVGIERRLPFSEGDSERPKKKIPEFESDMEEELDSALAESQRSWFPSASPSTGHSASGSSMQGRKKKVAKKRQVRFEGDVDESLGLFDQGNDSDEDFAKTEGMTKEKRDDELFYDPEQDKDNQAWVDSHRRDCYPPNQNQPSLRPLPKSDAVLNCPACMTLLCLDCQRHEIYKTQYRAMFVHNCTVKQEESLFLPSGPSKKSRKKQKKSKGNNDSGKRSEPQDPSVIPEDSRPQDLFKPVLCSVCSSEVGVYDSDEVYHFFNVLSSYT